MPCYNAAARIREAVLSVFAQSFDDLELIVVDDGSTDGSGQILREIGDQEPRLRLIRQVNQGAGPARNTGLTQARGEFVAFLDADDTWDIECLQTLHATLSAHPHAALTYCGWQNLGVPENRGRPFVPPDYENPDKIETLLRGCRWPIHAALTRRAVIESVGGFDPQWTSSMDYDLWLRIAAFHPIVLTPRVLAYYHHHEGEQITKNRLRIATNHACIQRKFLADHSAVAARLGREKVRAILGNELLQRAYTSYWGRDLNTAHALFRQILWGGYCRLSDLKYVLPAILPFGIYAALVARLGK